VRCILDTSAVLALLAPEDEHHAAARKYVREERSLRLETTVAAVAEVYTVLRRRRGYRFAMDWADGFRSSDVVTIEPSTRDQDNRAWDILHRLAGVPLSYVDASLIALATRLRVDTIFTFDVDFRDAGLKVVPGL
jgi:uncharacterized protein